MVTQYLEKHSFKLSLGIAATLVVFLVTMTSNFSSWKSNMEAEHVAMNLRQDHLSEGHASIRADVAALEKRQDGADLVRTNISARLLNIETLLVEIKQEMRDDRKVVSF